MKYTEFQKLAVKLGLKLVGQQVNVSTNNVNYFISCISVYPLHEHNCKICTMYARRWIDKNINGNFQVSLGFTITNNKSSTPGIDNALCSSTIRLILPNLQLESLLVKKPGAGNFKKGPKQGKAKLKTETVKEAEANKRWELDLEL